METEKVTRNGLYPVALYNLRQTGYSGALNKLRARWTGEKRPPLKGEWFLSGNPVEAHLSYHDLGTVYHIAELVTVESTASYHVTGVYKLGGRR